MSAIIQNFTFSVIFQYRRAIAFILRSIFFAFGKCAPLYARRDIETLGLIAKICKLDNIVS